MSLLKTLKLAAVAFALTLVLSGTSVLAVNYTAPTTQPPVCPDGAPGCDSPIHTGTAAQSKIGNFGIGLPIGVGPIFKLEVEGNALVNGSVGITNTVNPRYLRFLGEAGDSAIESSVNTTNGTMYYRSSDNKFRCKQNGAWVDCIGGGTSTGGGFWADAGSNNINNTNSGNVLVGTNISTAAKMTVVANNTLPKAADFVIDTDFSTDAGAPGANYHPGVAVNAVNSGDNGVAVVGQAFNTTVGDWPIGGKFIADGAGVFTRSNKIGIYASNKGGNVGGVDIGWFLPSSVKSGPSYAGYFYGPVRISSSLTDTSGSGLIVASTSGNGAEAYTFTDGKGAFAAFASGNGAIGFLTQSVGPNGYGAKLIGTYANFVRGDKIGLYASNKPGETSIPAAVASGSSYAGYFNGATRFADTVGGTASGNLITNSLGIGRIFESQNGGYMAIGFGANPTDTAYALTGDTSSTWVHAPTALWLGAAANQQVIGLNNLGATVFGKLGVVDGTQGANKVLTSNANGVASWKSLSGGSGNLRIVPDTANAIEVEVSGPNGCKGQQVCSIMCPAGMVMIGFPEFDDKDDSHVRHMMCAPLIIQAVP